jgi:hypothetical protein
MKQTQQFLTAGALALLVSLSACDNDDEKGSQLSKNDAKAEIATFNGSATSDIGAFADADGVKAMQDFFALADSDPFGRLASDKNKFRTFIRNKGREFRSVFGPSKATNGKINGSEPFDFNENKGVYVWDAAQEIFVKSENPSDVIEIHFPTEGSLTNNARIEITAYAEKFIEDEWEAYYEPTTLEASLYVNNSEKASVDFEVSYDDLGFPTEASVNLLVSPYSVSLSFNESNSTSATVSFSLKKDQSVLAATSVTVKYDDSSKSEESISSIEGFVQLKNLKVQGSVDPQGADTENPDLNDFIHLELFSDNAKLGDIVFVTEDGQDIPYVQYADGTKEKLETVFQPVVDELEELSDSLESNG